MIFVFGSNLSGRHGAGSALYARRHYGAIYGRGEGLQGNSYAIPTKDKRLRRLSTDEICLHVTTFIEFALCHPELRFKVVAIGCGLAGYEPKDIAWMFDLAPRNVILPRVFLKELGR